MTISFENKNIVIVHALKKMISFARNTQYIFVAECVWWLAAMLGLQQGLIIYIDNLNEWAKVGTKENWVLSIAQKDTTRGQVISTTPRDITEDQWAEQILDRAERFIKDSEQTLYHLRQQWINPQPQTKSQLKKARKTKRLKEPRSTSEATRQKRLQEMRDQVIKNLGQE